MQHHSSPPSRASWLNWSRLDQVLSLLIALLPWSILAGVFFGNVIGIPGVNFLKEILLAIFALLVGYKYYQSGTKPKLDIIDYSAISFVVILTIITFANSSGLASYIYGGRYDFEWIFALIIAKHAVGFLGQKYNTFLKIFFWSGGVALALGILIRFVLNEDILLSLGFGGNLSNWTLGGQIPIYHGVEGANVRRFQGIFDGPNPAAAFLLVYIPLYAAYIRPYKDYYYLASLGSIILFTTFFYTYSRSAILGLVGAICLLLCFHGKSFFLKHTKIFISFLLAGCALAGLLAIQYGDKFEDLILRKSSTDGHKVRMINGFNSFLEHPLGQGLASSGPAYRYVADEGFTKNEMLQEGSNKKVEDVKIPESWHIQILVEGGIFGFVSFAFFLIFIAWRLLNRDVFLFLSWTSIALMATFLHIYEATFAVLCLALFTGLKLGTPMNEVAKKQKKNRSTRHQ